MTAHITLLRDRARRQGSGPRSASRRALAGARGENVCPVAIRVAGTDRGAIVGFQMQRGRGDEVTFAAKIGRSGTLEAGYRQPRATRNGAGAGWGGRTP